MTGSCKCWERPTRSLSPPPRVYVLVRTPVKRVTMSFSQGKIASPEGSGKYERFFGDTGGEPSFLISHCDRWKFCPRELFHSLCLCTATVVFFFFSFTNKLIEALKEEHPLHTQGTFCRGNLNLQSRELRINSYPNREYFVNPLIDLFVEHKFLLSWNRWSIMARQSRSDPLLTLKRVSVYDKDARSDKKIQQVP